MLYSIKGTGTKNVKYYKLWNLRSLINPGTTFKKWTMPNFFVRKKK
jgi:hypothetical protein